MAILAILLALCNLGGENARKRVIVDSIRANDVLTSHEGAITRQLQLSVSSRTLNAVAQALGAGADGAARQQVSNLATQYQDLAEHPPVADPANHGPTVLSEGTSIEQLAELGKEYEHAAEYAEEQNEFYELGTAVLEVSLVLGSIAILITSRAVLAGAFAFGVLGTLLGLNGLLLLVALP